MGGSLISKRCWKIERMHYWANISKYFLAFLRYVVLNYYLWVSWGFAIRLIDGRLISLSISECEMGVGWV